MNSDLVPYDFPYLAAKSEKAASGFAMDRKLVDGLMLTLKSAKVATAPTTAMEAMIYFDLIVIIIIKFHGVSNLI